MPRSSYTTPQIQFRAGSLDSRLAARASQPEMKSEIARRDLHRYYDLLDAVRPRFAEEEALLLCDALNGTLFDEHAATFARTLVHEISDALDLGQLADKWEIDGDALLTRLRSLTVPELVATIDAVERFWAGQSGSDASQQIRAVGLVAP